MKKTYTFEVTQHYAYSNRKFCSCGGRVYEIWRQIFPDENGEHGAWSVYCPFCGKETEQYFIKRNAIHRWEEINT